MKKYLKYIILLIVILIVIFLVIFLIKDDGSRQFSKKYSNVPKDNVFKKISAEDAVKLVKNKTGILYLGYPDCPWCKQLVPLLNKSAKASGVDSIYYIEDFYKMRPDKNDNPINKEEYKQLVDLIGSDIVKDNIIRVPLVLFINKGNIVSYHSGTYEGHVLKEKIDKDGNKKMYLEDLTKSQENDIINVLNSKMEKVYPNKCDSGC